jgi:hypothetical protein
MKTTLGEVRRLIAKVMTEIGSPTGSLRRVRGGSGRQVKLGKIEDENRELSPAQVESMFPGAADAWAEVVPDMFPDFPFDDPQVIKARSLWFKIGSQLRVTFAEAPQIELAFWDDNRQDWFPLEDLDVAATG